MFMILNCSYNKETESGSKKHPATEAETQDHHFSTCTPPAPMTDATPLVLIMWPCKLKLDKEKSKV
jgi:hypothetical protein